MAIFCCYGMVKLNCGSYLHCLFSNFIVRYFP